MGLWTCGHQRRGLQVHLEIPGQRAPGLQQISKFIWEIIKVKAEVLALANGNNQQGLMHME